MNEPTVTVLMPLKHYRADFLEAALQSLFRQTCADWRLCIIVEPQDHTALLSILAKSLQDARVRLVVNQGRKLAGAFNTGMRCADTEFVAILFADDLWAQDAIAVLNEEITRLPDVDFFHSGRAILDENARPISSALYDPDTFTVQDYLDGNTPVKHLLCWRRNFALAFGGMDETLNSVGPDDYDFPWTMLEQGARFQAIHRPLYLYRDHRAFYRLTTHLPLALHKQETARIMRKHGASEKQIRAKLKAAERSYLRQCLYHSWWDEWLGRKFGIRLRRTQREQYR